MNAEAIARRALEHADHRSPDATIRAALRELGIVGDFSDEEFRAAYLAVERAWRPMFLRLSERAAVCAGDDCDTPLRPHQRKWCSRDCWSGARAKGIDYAKRDAEIVRLRRESDETLEAIGRRYGVSAKRVWQILNRDAA